MPRRHYAGDVQQAIADEITQLRAQQQYAPAPQANAKAGKFVPPPREEDSAFGGLGSLSDADSAPDDRFSQAEQESSSRQRAVSPPPPAYARVPVPPPAPAASVPAPAAVPPGSVTALPSTNIILTSLDERINRLEQVRRWIGEDGEMARFLDTVIGQQVKASERRQARLTVALNIIFLIAGWALSYFLSPANTFGKLLGL